MVENAYYVQREHPSSVFASCNFEVVVDHGGSCWIMVARGHGNILGAGSHIPLSLRPL